MKMRDIDLYNMPKWLEKIVDEVTNECEEMLKKEPNYNEYEKEGEKLLEQYEFISEFLSTLIEKEKIKTLSSPSKEDIKALSQYLSIENDQMELRNIQFYLLGCRHVIRFMRMVDLL